MPYYPMYAEPVRIFNAPKASTMQSYNSFHVSSELKVSSRGILSRYSVQFLTFCTCISHHHSDGGSRDEIDDGLSVNDGVLGAQDSETE